MILAFIIAYSYSIVLLRLLKCKYSSLFNTKNLLEKQNASNDFELAYDGGTFWENGEFKFTPPVYIQRYMVVRDLLEKLGPFKKIADLGCADLSFFTYLKNLEGAEELVFVDQDAEILHEKSQRTKPFTIDHLKRREFPLLVKVLHGNAAAADRNLAGTLAVVAIELIEHMFPPDLDELPYTLFEVIQPQVVILTTPNYDFNILFKKSGFRHLDHKFEWTRQQFKDWADNLVLRFPSYTCKLYGIGAGPEGTSQYGACSQMVLFQRISSTSIKDQSSLFLECHHVISEFDYPFEKPVEISLQDRIKNEAERFLFYAVTYHVYQTNDRIEIPLTAVMRMLDKITDSVDLLQSVLEENKWRIEENDGGEKCVVLPLTGISYSSSSSEHMDAVDGEDGIAYEFDDTDLNNCWSESDLKCEEDWTDNDSVASVQGFSCNCVNNNLRTKRCGHSFDEVIDLIRGETVANHDDSCSQSKAADSGYPNTSDREMDMDLTPEQVDEIVSENESSLDEREEEEAGELGAIGGGAPIQFVDHVENGDVANNNRDGEGNNLDQGEVGEPLHFQQLILEEANFPPLNEQPPQQDSDSENEDKFLPRALRIHANNLASGMQADSERMVGSDSDLPSLCVDRLPSDDSPAILACSSTSLLVHTSTSDSVSLVQTDTFPSWLLNMLVDDAESASEEPQEGNGTSELQEFLSVTTLEDWSNMIIPEDIMGGGEPHTDS